MSMRDRIKVVATELLIMHGVRGLRFSEIATRLGITRANIHHHFGTKKNLVEEVIEDYVQDTLEQVRAIWTEPDRSYQDKTRRMMAFNRRRYARYNPGTKAGRPWSLISRMRLEIDQLGAVPRKTLRAFTTAIEACIYEAVEAAQTKGELTADAPVKDIAIQLIAIVDSAGSITQDCGSFERLERLYMAHISIISHAYGGREV
jgi:TetR/AcrR family transcriptional regulator, transcriptional repressor for nem operon